MKKDRNSFFSEYGYNAYNNVPQGMMPNMNGFQSFNQVNGYNTNTGDDYLDSRVSKLEREIKVLESRVSKLESGVTLNNTTNNDYNFANSMYMV